MLPKSDGCTGCAMLGDGFGWVPDRRVDGAQVAVVFQNPGEDEEVGQRVVELIDRRAVYEPCDPQPLVGRTGYYWETKLLPLTGLTRDQVSIHNILKCRQIIKGERRNDMPRKDKLTACVAQCTGTYLQIPTSVKLVVAAGAHATKFAGCPGTVSEWRGFTFDGVWRGRTIPTLAVLHPADLFRTPKMVLPSMKDWEKVRRWLAGEWPRPIPDRTIVRGWMPQELEEWFHGAQQAPWVAVDTEYHRESKYLTLIGLGYPGMRRGLQVEWAHTPPDIRRMFARLFGELARQTPIVFQNAMADVPVLERATGVTWETYKQVDDLMLGHALVWSDMPHDLEFLASVYGVYPKMKHLAKVKVNEANKEEVRAMLQAVYSGQRLQALRDIPESGEVLPVAQKAWQDKAGLSGLARDPEELLRDMRQTSDKSMATSFMGSLPQNPTDARAALLDLQRWAGNAGRGERSGGAVVPSTVDALEQELKYIYNWGDVLDTVGAWEQVREGLVGDPALYNIYRTRSIPLVPIYLRAHQGGMKIDREYTRQAFQDLTKVWDAAQLDAEAYAGYPLKLSSTSQVKWHLNNLPCTCQSCSQQDTAKYVRCRSVRMEKVFELLRNHPGNDVLVSRYRWAQADGFRRIVKKLKDLDEIHCHFLPTQNAGRTSVTEPNVVGLPGKDKAKQRGFPNLRRCIVPFPGTFWWGFDYSGLHARIMAGMSRDVMDLEAFAKGYDLHVMTACAASGLPMPPDLSPKWTDSPAAEEWRQRSMWSVGDRRRHMAKTVRYAMLNGYDHTAVREATEVIEQGLDMDELEEFAKRFLRAKPNWSGWKRAYVAQAIYAGEARSLYGGKRVLIHYDDYRAQFKTAVSSFFMRTEVDIVYETMIEICRRYPQGRLVYPSHDGLIFAFGEDGSDPEQTAQNLTYENQAFIERPHDFNGVSLSLPADYSVYLPDGRVIELTRREG